MASSLPGTSLDPIALPLSRNERPATWGLNLNAFPQGQGDLAIPFQAWKDTITPLLSGTGAYAYDPAYLHVTASSPAPFTHAPLVDWTEDEKATYTTHWHSALRKTCVVGGHPSWPSEPFPLTFKTLELHASCAIFMVDDPTQGLRRIREAVAGAAELVAAGPAGPLLAKSGWKSPKIVHSTIMRLVTPPEQGANVVEAWGRAAQEWKEVTIMCHQMTFLKEIVPFQHLDPEPNSPQFVLDTFPYGPTTKPFEEIKASAAKPRLV